MACSSIASRSRCGRGGGIAARRTSGDARDGGALFHRPPPGRHVRRCRGRDRDASCRADFAAQVDGRDAARGCERAAGDAACRACADLAARPEMRRVVVAASTASARASNAPACIRYFEHNVFSASDVPNGKPAPDLFLHVGAAHRHRCRRIASWSRIRRPASPPRVAAGMTAIGFVGGSHAGRQSRFATDGGRRAHGDRRHARAQGHGGRAARVLDPVGSRHRLWRLPAAACFAGCAASAALQRRADRSRHRSHRPRARPVGIGNGQVFLDMGERHVRLAFARSSPGLDRIWSRPFSAPVPSSTSAKRIGTST